MVEEIRKAINASSRQDLLWVIEAAKPDVLFDAVIAASASKLKYVTVVTHHKNNDLGRINATFWPGTTLTAIYVSNTLRSLKNLAARVAV